MIVLHGQWSVKTQQWVVGGLEHGFYFPFHDVILPIDFHIFQDGRSTTNQMGDIAHHDCTAKDLWLPSGKRLHNYGKSPFLMGKLTISMAIFSSFLYVYQRVQAMESWNLIKPREIASGSYARHWDPWILGRYGGFLK